jgi:hypothetical protein
MRVRREDMEYLTSLEERRPSTDFLKSNISAILHRKFPSPQEYEGLAVTKIYAENCSPSTVHHSNNTGHILASVRRHPTTIISGATEDIAQRQLT